MISVGAELRRFPWRQVAVSFISMAYLGTLAVYLGRQAMGDTSSAPAACFFTWDMFPNYQSWSSRRVALGKTAKGNYVELHPSSTQKYRGGTRGDLTRADLDRSGSGLKQFADQALSHASVSQSHDPVVHVWLQEEYWPEKFNLRDDLYEEVWGQAKPDRTYWRTLSEYDVPRLGPVRFRVGAVGTGDSP